MHKPAKTRPTSEQVTAAIRLISAFGELFDIHDTPGETLALEAFDADRAAFWRTAGYSNQASCNLCDAANLLGLEAALSERAARNSEPVGAAQPLCLLATLVPMNGKARAELVRCREAEMAKRDLQFVKAHLAPLAANQDEMADSI